MVSLGNGKERELEVERACLVWLNQNGWFAWKNPSLGVYDVKSKSFRKPAPFTLRGASDCIAIRSDGLVAFIEFKAEGGRQSEHQALFQNQITKNKGHYILVRSLEGMISELDQIQSK
jgi:hypothetical protein